MRFNYENNDKLKKNENKRQDFLLFLPTSGLIDGRQFQYYEWWTERSDVHHDNNIGTACHLSDR